MNRRSFLRLECCLVSLATLTTATYGSAQTWTPKTKVDQRGDFVLFGNTLGWDCANASTAAVLTGAVDCTDATNTTDSAIDLYWRSDEPTDGAALASTAVTMENARSTAVLELPTGAVVTYARLYWGALQPGAGAVDNSVTIERPGNTNVLVATAKPEDTWISYVSGTNNGKFWYQGAADVTEWMASLGAGPFRVGGVSSINDLYSSDDNNNMAGWYVVVFYSLATDLPRNLTLFEGLRTVNPSTTQTAVINGFLVPSAFDAKLGVVAFEGDADADGDSLRIGLDDTSLVALTDALNPEDNFFNSTHSYLGVGVQTVGDLPRLSGASGSMGGIDIDVIDVKANLAPNQTSATIRAASSGERVGLATLVASISTYKPDFATSGKTVADANAGSLVPGDELEYTISATNTGSDTSTNTIMTDTLPSQVTYKANSLELVSPVAKTLSDQAGDDTGEFVGGKVIVRLGTDASPTAGGKMAVGERIVLKFRVTLDAGASGLIENQAIISATGEKDTTGAPATNYLTDGNGSIEGTPPTTIGVDSDGDGLADAIEAAIGTDSNDADSDDDGVLDGDESSPEKDSDGDGLINALDPDSDNDGLFDGTELGLGCANEATNFAARRCVADLDPATTTNPTLADTDGGGVRDGAEDANLNGRLDEGETNPITGQAADDANVTDSDQDGLSDALEATLGSNPNDRDSDDDGVLDGLESNPSEDGDFDDLVDVVDADSDNDGLFDGTEMGLGCDDLATNKDAKQCVADADPSTQTCAVDPDTDGGGVRDGSEDVNGNGRLDGTETNPVIGNASDDANVANLDTDGDGLPDIVEQALGSNSNDRDSDDDGLPDGEEANPAADTDLDGLINILDNDSDGDGLFDGTELGRSCDGTGTATNNPVTCIADADSGQTVTSPIDPDTDHGGIKDGDEDKNRNGVVDANERDPRVRADDSWGCLADADCSANTTSGRVCNANHQCVDGCRGTGGNGCPSGQVCSSTTTDIIGTCSTPVGTGGAAGAAGAAGAGGELVATGGSVATGGTTTTMGAAGTSVTTGGAAEAGASGSTPVVTAGNTSIGGATTAVATGGNTDAGAATTAVATGGNTSAGAAATAVATGGSMAATGAAASAEGGADEVGGSAVGQSRKGGIHSGEDLEGAGCDCAVAGKNGSSSAWLLTLIAGLLSLRRRRMK